MPPIKESSPAAPRSETNRTNGEGCVHAAFPHQNTTEIDEKIEFMRKHLGQLEELQSRRDPVDTFEAADEKHKYMEDLGNARRAMKEAYASLDASLDKDMERLRNLCHIPRGSASAVGMEQESTKAGPVHADSDFPMSTAMPPQTVMQQPQQMQQAQPRQSLVYKAAPGGRHFLDARTNSVRAFIRVAKRKANSRNRRRLLEDVLFVGSEGVLDTEGALKIIVTIPVEEKTEKTEKPEKKLSCNKAMLHLDGQAFEGLGGCTRYRVWMYANEAEPAGELGDGWHEYG